MKINLENYESWFLDHVEGNLSAEQELLLQEFLEKHPALKQELDEFEMVMLDDFEASFPEKESLKKSEVSVIGFDDYIAFHEGDLSKKEEKAVLDHIEKDVVAKKDFTSFSKAYLTPDESVTFDNKSELIKRETAIIVMYWRQIAVAASILFVAGVLFFNNQPTHPVLVDATEKEGQGTDSVITPIEFEMKHGNEAVAIVGEETENEAQNSNPESQDSKLISQDSKLNTHDNEVAAANRDAGEAEEQPQSPSKEIEDAPLNDPNHLAKSDEVEALTPMKAKSVAQPATLEEELVADVRDVDVIIENVNDMETVPPLGSETITAAAYVEKSVATAIMGQPKKKLKMFDVLKKIGDKSNLYTLTEESNDKFQLQVSGAKIKGNKQ